MTTTRPNVHQVTAAVFADWLAKHGSDLTRRGHTGFDIYINEAGQQVAQASYDYGPAVYKVDMSYQGKQEPTP